MSIQFESNKRKRERERNLHWMRLHTGMSRLLIMIPGSRFAVHMTSDYESDSESLLWLWVLTLTLIMITIMIMALAAGRSPALPCVVFWCPYQTLNRIKLCINTHCDDDDDDDARMSSHMPPKGTWGVVAQGNGAEAGAWFGKCNLMQTLRLHDDFIVECCAHTHRHTHMHARMCVSTYIYIWLTAAGALQTAADNAHTHSHTHSQIYLALLQLHWVLCSVHWASPLLRWCS